MKISHPKSGKSSCIIAMATLILLGISVSGARAGAPTDQLKSTLDQMINALNDPALKTKDKIQEKRDTLHNILKPRFDEEALAERALGNHWEKITPEEKMAFVKVFIALLEETYFDKIDAQLATAGDISSENIQYLKESIKGEYAQISTQILAGETDPIPVIYRLKNRNGDWRVVDMAIEGVVVTKNYRAQFNEILDRSSFDDLIKKLEDKLSPESK